MAELRDYVRWHDAYDDPGSTMPWRLGVVRGWVEEFLDRRRGPVRVVSSCAGDGRDLLAVLGNRDDVDRVTVVLVEIDRALAERARDAAASTAASVEIRPTDAGMTDACAGAVPADLVLLVGIFGNVSSADVRRTVAAAPSLCAPDAEVLWSLARGERDPGERLGHNETVRSWFTQAGFVEEEYEELDRRSNPAVGRMRLDGATAPLVPGSACSRSSDDWPTALRRNACLVVATSDRLAPEGMILVDCHGGRSLRHHDDDRHAGEAPGIGVRGAGIRIGDDQPERVPTAR